MTLLSYSLYCSLMNVMIIIMIAIRLFSVNVFMLYNSVLYIVLFHKLKNSPKHLTHTFPTNTHLKYYFVSFIRYDHQDRLTAKEAQSHPYFAPVREAEAREGVSVSPAAASTTGLA